MLVLERAIEKTRERIRIQYFLSQLSGSAKKLTLSMLLFFCTQEVCATLLLRSLFVHACLLFIFFPFPCSVRMSSVELSSVVLLEIIATFFCFVYSLNSDLQHACFFGCPKCYNLWFSWLGIGWVSIID